MLYFLKVLFVCKSKLNGRITIKKACMWTQFAKAYSLGAVYVIFLRVVFDLSRIIIGIRYQF